MDFFRRVHEHVVPGPRNSYRPHLLRRRWLVGFLALALLVEAVLVGNLALRQAGAPFLAAVVKSELFAHTNEARVAAGGEILTESLVLDAAAARKAADMAQKGYFAHVGPDGKVPWQWLAEAGYDYRSAGENLAVRFVDSKDVVDAWMRSPSHRANIVKGVYTEMGIGVAAGTYKGGPAVFVVQYFGTPRNMGAAIAQSGASSFFRQTARYFADPRQAAFWTLGLMAAVLIGVVGTTLVRHIQIQPAEAILPGAAVAAVMVTLIIINAATLAPQPVRDVAEAGSLEVGTGVFTERQ
jgi:hypothetical protein